MSSHKSKSWWSKFFDEFEKVGREGYELGQAEKLKSQSKSSSTVPPTSPAPKPPPPKTPPSKPVAPPPSPKPSPPTTTSSKSSTKQTGVILPQLDSKFFYKDHKGRESSQPYELWVILELILDDMSIKDLAFPSPTQKQRHMLYNPTYTGPSYKSYADIPGVLDLLV